MQFRPTYREGVPDHLAVHEFVADITFDKPAQRYQSHFEKSISNCSMPINRMLIIRKRSKADHELSIP